MSKRNVYKKSAKESSQVLNELAEVDLVQTCKINKLSSETNWCHAKEYGLGKHDLPVVDENDEADQFLSDSDDKCVNELVSEDLNDVDWDEISTFFRIEVDNEMQKMIDLRELKEPQSNPNLETSIDEENSLSDDLRLYYTMFHPSREAMNFLLKSLRKHGVDAPSSLYMLRKQSEKFNCNTEIVDKGKIAWISIVENLKFLVSRNLIKIDLTKNTVCPLNLKINIDGLPLFSGSNYQLWPILMLVNEYERPLPVGLFGGVGKPDIEVFMHKLRDEIKHLQQDGCVIEEVRFSLEQIVFICDTPARTHIQCINSHNAYYGCGYCRTKGEYYSNRITFPEVAAVDRTDEDYFHLIENNQSLPSPVLGIVPLKTGFPPEYMHLVLLGVTKKILFYAFLPTKGCHMKSRFSSAQIENISRDLMELSKFIPSEFQRKFYKGFKELVHFKATEYRTLLLYIGSFIFQPYMKPEIYNHFMLLSFGIYCFVSEKYYRAYHTNAKACLVKFVQLFPLLYDSRGMTYNVHVLQHLSDFVSLYGPLDKFSSFKFENYLGVLKRRIKPSSNIFEQSLNRMMDIRTAFQDVQMRELRFSEKAPDNCAVLQDGRIVIILSVTDKLITGKVLNFTRNLFSDPYPSKLLKIGYYSLTRLKVHNVLPVQKCISIPRQNEFLVIPVC